MPLGRFLVLINQERMRILNVYEHTKVASEQIEKNGDDYKEKLINSLSQ